VRYTLIFLHYLTTIIHLQEEKSETSIDLGGATSKQIGPKIVDGSKFDKFFEALVNIIVIIPVK
jgi:hypothetical protein